MASLSVLSAEQAPVWLVFLSVIMFVEVVLVSKT